MTQKRLKELINGYVQMNAKGRDVMSWTYSTSVEIMNEADSRRFAAKTDNPVPLTDDQRHRLRQAEEYIRKHNLSFVKKDN